MKKGLLLIPLLCIITAISTWGQGVVFPTSHPAQLRFTENKGQWDERISFRSRIPDGTIFLENNDFYFFLYSPADMSHIQHPGNKQPVNIHGHAFKEKFIGANPKPTLTGEEAYPDYANFYLGNDPNRWASGARIYSQVRYQNLYPKIDLLLQGYDDNLMRYDFILNVGADASKIKVAYEGVDGLTIENKELKVKTSVGELTEEKPFAYQLINGFKKEVRCDFVLKDTMLGFVFPDGYDKNFPLTIDPNIVFATYTGSTADNWGYTATYDALGDMYLGGYVNATTPGTKYPTTVGAFQLSFAGGTGGNNGGGNGIEFACDMGISKFTSDGTSLIYSTYLGGSDNETPNSLVVDAQGNLIIYGVSYSTNFPVTGNAYKRTNSGKADITITKLNATGTQLLGSTYIGGSEPDGINFAPDEVTAGNLKSNYGDQNRGEVNIDTFGNIYVASCTNSFNFPVTAGAIQTTFGGGQDGCAFKLNPDCSQLIWSTFLGGYTDDACYSLDLGPNGTLFVAGGTMSDDFPVTAGTLNTTYQGGMYDGFVARINSTGTQLLASSYMGTDGDDQVYFVKLDAAGNVYFVGQTTGQYPVQNAKYYNLYSGQFIEKVNPSLTSVYYSTVFGNGNSSPNISPTAFLVDTCENVYVAGWGARSNSVFAGFDPIFYKEMSGLPITPDALQKTTDGNDFYFFVLAKNAQDILYGSYYGGVGDGIRTGIEHVDGGTSRFDKRGIIYEAICAGCGGNSLTPTSGAGVWSPTNKSTNCNELGLKIAFNLTGTQVSIGAFPRATGCVPLKVQFQSVISHAAAFHWYFGDGATSDSINPIHTYVDTGTYNVILVGIDSNSCNITDTAFLQVFVRNDSISANFMPSVNVNCDSNRVALFAPGLPTSRYIWNLGDGATSTTQSVSHIYASSGNYNIRLILKDSTKCNLQDTFTSVVKIPDNIDAAFNTNSSYGCIPLPVNFTTTFSPTATYLWNFGDNVISSAPVPSHTYTTAGNFPVQLIVTDTNSCNKADTAYSLIVTIDSSAKAGFNLIRKFYLCDSVFVNVWTTYKGADSQRWDFGDGTIVSNVDSASHMYKVPGTYTLTHYLVDANMICKPADTATAMISLAPIHLAVSAIDTTGCLPFINSFTGVSNLFATSFYWFFGDGDSASGATVTHTYQKADTFHLKLIAVDTNSCVGVDSAMGQIIVTNDSVHANFLLNILNQCDSNLVVSLTNQSTNALQYHWNFGDQTSSTAANENHSYHLPATYFITLAVTDTNRCYPADSITKPVTLLPNTVVDFAANGACLGNLVQFTNTGNPAATYLWSFGDGHSSNAYAPSYLYTAAGIYNVRVMVVDTTSCNVRDTAAHSLEIYEQPVADFTLSKDSFGYELPVNFTNKSKYYTRLFWSFGDGDTSDEDGNPVHVYEKIGEMNVCLVATNEVCDDTTCKTIFISFSKIIGVPNAFSPNGDNVNDLVKVEGKGMIEFVFRIYNRWGEKVFETHDKNEGWNGIYGGALQEMDVYTYVVEAKLITGENVTLKGNITLLR